MMGSEDNPSCPFHPRLVVVGICAVCLKERLLVLAAKQGRLPKATNGSSSNKVGGSGTFRRTLFKKPSVTIPKVFALSTSLLLLRRRPAGCHRKPCPAGDSSFSSFRSLEDSFISIRFEDGRAGAASRSKMVAKEGIPCSSSSNNGTRVVELGDEPAVRWRRRVGHLFQVMRWWRSGEGSALVGKVDVVRNMAPRTTTTT